MGRRKIEIQPINDERNRTVTFVKRKAGLFKKAHELSILCKVDIAVIIIGHNHKVYEYSSNEPQAVIDKYQQSEQTQESKRPQDYGNYKLISRLSTKKGTRAETKAAKSEPIEEDILDQNSNSDVDDDDGDDDEDFDDTPSKKRKLSRSPRTQDSRRRPAFVPLKESGQGQSATRMSKRPLLSLQIPSNDRSSSDSAITVTALESSSINKDKDNENTDATGTTQGTQNSKKVSILATPTSNSFLPGLNIVTQHAQNPLDQGNSSNKSTPVSATMPHGLFSSIPQMSPTQILPTPIFPMGSSQQQHMAQQQGFGPYSAKFQPKSTPGGGQPFFNYTGDTPVLASGLPSGLPSRYLDMFPSPNVYYSQEWSIPMGTGNTPLPGTGPHMLPGVAGQPPPAPGGPQAQPPQQGTSSAGDSAQKTAPSTSTGSSFAAPLTGNGAPNQDGNFSTLTTPLQVIGSAIYNQAAQVAERRDSDK
ncbi:hypothetical protein OGAPHI_006173 [Ogataea philodendri]|uniref:MADS-box domain-containing protein n=1 Tax=Ogataea philodendri TaxID=1378263 RepID=A0A9P8NZC3_9ASCO|nr:uncharacterized protein OGAPHI_006173 [Ogataea philodendri]KAH3661992.1 hypothetical protein OGAPHI_006173 [Ogataea philodendri]